MTEAETSPSRGNIARVGLGMILGSYLSTPSLHHASGTDPEMILEDMRIVDALERTASPNPYKPVKQPRGITLMMVSPMQVNGIRTDGEFERCRERNLGDARDESS